MKGILLVIASLTATGVYAHEHRYADDADALYQTRSDFCGQFGRFASVSIGEHWDETRALANDEGTILTFVHNKKKAQELRELARRITDNVYSDHLDFPNNGEARGRELCERL
ncbi:hypothetical protein [Caballeronia sp. ATUFL_M2_KS44]|uniref:hypothetical protein n=1 Tax=Caballeronia sp. ATUFL_M2_KS44 TaxID=2921767 RepID=UPI002028AEE8|nr:hypothetical protein [Caballeronia sp. ATUFL_M2_KS44]